MLFAFRRVVGLWADNEQPYTQGNAPQGRSAADENNNQFFHNDSLSMTTALYIALAKNLPVPIGPDMGKLKRLDRAPAGNRTATFTACWLYGTVQFTGGIRALVRRVLQERGGRRVQSWQRMSCRA